MPLSRRGFLTSTLAVIGGTLLPRPAWARRPRPARLVPGRVYRGHPGRTGVAVLGGGFARLAWPLAITGTAVFSRSNANDRYLAVAQLGTLLRHGPYLVLAGGVVRASSWGSGFGGTAAGSVTFELDRAQADEVARLWRVPRRDRSPLGAGLVGRWRAGASRFTPGAPMPVVLTLANQGTAPVWLMTGGRQRGPRDNRFHFAATAADGSPIAGVDAPDFGGPGAYEELAPGASKDVGADLARWVALGPGGYQVTCRYQLELVTGPAGAPWPDHGHETWDWETVATLAVVVS